MINFLVLSILIATILASSYDRNSDHMNADGSVAKNDSTSDLANQCIAFRTRMTALLTALRKCNKNYRQCSSDCRVYYRAAVYLPLSNCISQFKDRSGKLTQDFIREQNKFGRRANSYCIFCPSFRNRFELGIWYRSRCHPNKDSCKEWCLRSYRVLGSLKTPALNRCLSGYTLKGVQISKSSLKSYIEHNRNNHLTCAPQVMCLKKCTNCGERCRKSDCGDGCHLKSRCEQKCPIVYFSVKSTPAVSNADDLQPPEVTDIRPVQEIVIIDTPIIIDPTPAPTTIILSTSMPTTQTPTSTLVKSITNSPITTKPTPVYTTTSPATNSPIAKMTIPASITTNPTTNNPTTRSPSLTPTTTNPTINSTKTKSPAPTSIIKEPITGSAQKTSMKSTPNKLRSTSPTTTKATIRIPTTNTPSNGRDPSSATENPTTGSPSKEQPSVGNGNSSGKSSTMDDAEREKVIAGDGKLGSATVLCFASGYVVTVMHCMHLYF